MPTWKHKNHTITVNSAGQFECSVCSEVLRAPSLELIKPLIDKEIKAQLRTTARVSCFFQEWHELITAEVTSRASIGYGPQFWIVDESGQRSKQNVAFLFRLEPDTVKKYNEIQSEIDRLGAEQDKLMKGFRWTEDELMKEMGIATKSEDQ